MSTRITIPEFARRVRDLGGEMKTAVQMGMVKAAQRLDAIMLEEIDHAEPFPAVDRGILRASRFVKTSASGTITVGVEAPHWPYINKGTRPFWAPIGPLIDWVRRKGLATEESEVRSIAYAVQHKIATEGIKPRNIQAKAIARFKAEKVMAKTVGNELRKLARKRGGK